MMLIALFKKFIYMLRIHIKQNKCQYLIKNHEINGLKNVKDPKAFTEYSS